MNSRTTTQKSTRRRSQSIALVLLALLSLALLALTLLPSPAAAQAPGTGAGQPAQGAAPAPAAPGAIQTQGRDVTPVPQQAIDGPPAGTTIDFREEMRRFISSISTYARKVRPDFTILTLNGLDLLTKSLAGDETKRYPARAYIRSIDGVIQESAFYGVPTIDTATVDERKTPLLGNLDTATANRLQVLTIDYAKTPKTMDSAIRLAEQKGYIPFVSPARPLSSLPAYPRRPVNENPKSIVSLSEIKNFLYLPESTGFGREDEYALALHGTNYDILIVDVFHGRTALSKRAVETMKYKKIGAKRLVLARLNIGTAEAYRYYWKPGWREGSPPWIGAPYPANPDRYYVQFWRSEWQALISGDNRSYLFGILQQGFDGVVLDGIETYRYFEGTAESVEATR